MPSKAQLRALNRFGLGARPGEADTIDPRAWLLAQIKPEAAKMQNQALPTTQALIEEMAEFRRNGRDARQAYQKRSREVVEQEGLAVLGHGFSTRAPFAERLARFWSNHFCVSTVGENEVRYLAGAYEREAIRPHVFGRFEDMVLASAQHPAMLVYLDQARSIGPNSRIGKRRDQGLNENYARELLELHTLGVGAYSQADVRSLALMLTGWTVGGFQFERNKGLKPFTFVSNIHEPGSKDFLGYRYAESGLNEGLQAISFLVRHPSTAHFIATKLVRHFVADEPDPRDVQTIAAVFYQSGGDLAQVARALVNLDTPFVSEARKFRTPQEYLTAIGRAVNLRQSPKALPRWLRELRHLPWAPLSPAGYGDTLRDWADPDSLTKRQEIAQSLAGRGRRLDAAALAEQVIEARNSQVLRQALKSQSSNKEAFALLLASPDFQWR